jgi:arabinoxylan arabinofuranohydrolase
MNRLLPLLAAAAFATCSTVHADYSIASHRYLADPTSLAHDGRVYIYCSNDDESPVEGGYNIPNIICISSADMKNWTDHGSVFRAAEATTWAQRTWAPGAIERDGKFFLYFGNGGANIGVAVADSPIGPFRDPLGGPLITHQTPGVQPARNMWLFDPGAFIDDDGQAYLYFGGNGDDNVRVAKLNRDMISIDGEIIKMSAPAFFEAAWVYKRNGIYYFSYSTQPRAGMRWDYMTSDHPTQGFVYRGIVSEQHPINNNNHHAALFEFQDRWYHVYHNRVVSRQSGIPGAFRRNLGIEEMYHEDDGSIRKVVYTEDGVEQRGRLNPFVRVEAETFSAQKGVETTLSSAGGMCLTDLQDGDWVRVSGVDFKSGAKKFTARVASLDDNTGRIHLRLGSPEGQEIGAVRVPSTAGDQKWVDVSSDVTGAEGVHDLFIVFSGEKGKTLFNFDYWMFE